MSELLTAQAGRGFGAAPVLGHWYCKLVLTASLFQVLFSRIEYPVNQAIVSVSRELDEWLKQNQRVRTRRLEMALGNAENIESPAERMDSL